MGEFVIHNGLKLDASLASSDGEPLLARTASTGLITQEGPLSIDDTLFWKTSGTTALLDSVTVTLPASKNITFKPSNTDSSNWFKIDPGVSTGPSSEAFFGQGSTSNLISFQTYGEKSGALNSASFQISSSGGSGSGGNGGTIQLLNRNELGVIVSQISLLRSGLVINVGSDAVGDIYQRNSSGRFSRLAAVASGNVLISGGVGTVNSWGKVGLSTHVSGTLGPTNGGTGLTGLGSPSNVLKVNSAGTALEYGTYGSNTQVIYNSAGVLQGSTSFTFDGSTVNAKSVALTGFNNSIILDVMDDSSFSILTVAESGGVPRVQLNLGSDSTGDIYYRNSSGNLSKLAIGTEDQVLTVSSTGIPEWAAPTGGGGGGTWGSITGTLSDQTDLQTTLDGKADLSGDTFTGKVSFTADATNAGVNIGTVSGNPSTLSPGDIWYNSLTNYFGLNVAGSVRQAIVSVPADINTANRLIVVSGQGRVSQTGSDATYASNTLSVPNISVSTGATLPANTTIGSVSATEISYLDNVTSSIQTQLNGKLSTTPPGSNMNIIFNDGGSYGADAGLSYDKTADLFSVTGQTIMSSDNANNNSVSYLLALQHTTSGTPGNGIGAGLTFSVETTTSNTETGATIEAVVTDVTATSEDFDLVFKTMAAGAAASEKLRISSFGGIGLGGTNYGSAGQVLTSNGSSSAPTWEDAATTLAVIEDVSTTTYNFVEADNGKIKRFTHASGCTATVPTGLSTGWNCVAYRADGAGITTLASAGTIEGVGTTLETDSTAATIVHRGSNVHVLLGPLGTTGGGGGITNSANINEVAISDGTNIVGDASFTWDSTNNVLTIDSKRIASGAASVYFGGGTTSSTGSSNTGIGYQSLNALTSGVGNTAIGTQALTTVVSGGDNTAVGYGALSLVTANYNIGLGYQAGNNITTGERNVVIGTDVDAQSATANGQLSIQNAIFGSGNTTSGTTVASGNIGFFATTWGTSAAKVISVGTGTSPSTSITDGYQMYSADITAGNAAPHFRSEAGHIIKLYQVNNGSAYSVSNGTTDRTFDANSTTMDELADVLATLIADLKLTGILA